MPEEKDKQSSSDDGGKDDSLLIALLYPGEALAKWYLSIGSLGLFLSILNVIGMIDDVYRVSWSGLLTMEALGDALLMKDSSPSFAISDAVFMILCGGLVFLGFRWVNSKEGGASSFLRGLFINDTWSSLTNPVLGGWSKTGGAWCLLVGVLFYMYWGVRYTRWIDPGVYVVTIALLASGIALKGVSQVTPQES